MSMLLHIVQGDRIARDDIIRRLVEMQYSRNELEFLRGTYRIRGKLLIFSLRNQTSMRFESSCLMMKSIRFVGLIH
jgi:excinuclease UvrABC helicase subunit UvrB